MMKKDSDEDDGTIVIEYGVPITNNIALAPDVDDTPITSST